MFTIHFATSKELVSNSVYSLMCLQLYLRVRSHRHSMSLDAPVKILPTALFPAGGNEGKVEEENAEKDEICGFIV